MSVLEVVETMSDVISRAKQQLRKKFLHLMKSLSAQDLERRSSHVEDSLWELPCIRQARRIMVFYPLTGEPDLRRMMRKLLQDKKELFLPVIDEASSMLIPYPVTDIEHLITGPYQTRQPVVSPGVTFGDANPEVVIVPGLAFTPEGGRLGRGKGYYDRFLSTLPENVPAVGVCFSFQLVDSLPMHSSDKKVTFVVSA